VEATARDRDVGDLASIPDAVTQAARQAVADLPTAEQSRVGRVAQMISAQFTFRHGRKPGPAELASIDRFAVFVTRRGLSPAWRSVSRLRRRRPERRGLIRTSRRSGSALTVPGWKRCSCPS
jgi:hypothetical protein